MPEPDTPTNPRDDWTLEEALAIIQNIHDNVKDYEELTPAQMAYRLKMIAHLTGFTEPLSQKSHADRSE